VGYPPFSRLALIRIDAPEEEMGRVAAAKLAAVGRATPDALARRVEVLGPAPAPIARLRGRFRFRVLLRAKDRGPLRAVVERVAAAREELDRQVRAAIDIDPVSML
jgi:primosomal protein N' (replication factor Y)